MELEFCYHLLEDSVNQECRGEKVYIVVYRIRVKFIGVLNESLP